jgi:hypothetical protein
MAAISLHVTDIDDLEQACKVLGLRLDRDRSTWRWFGSWVDDYHKGDAAYLSAGIKPAEYGKCADHVITIPGDDTCYEIGVVRRRDGQPGWVLIYDFWGSEGQRMADRIQATEQVTDPETKQTTTVTDRAGLLKQAYEAAFTHRRMTAKGFDARIIKKGNGHVQCVGRRRKAQRIGR